MLRFNRFLLLPFALSAVLAVGQQSAGGYGQGGGNGGFGGGSMGPGSFGRGMAPNMPLRRDSDKKARPDADDEAAGLWESKTAILTPGDQYEIKLKMKAGDTLLAGATSDSFDAALSIENSDKKVLVENDDRAEGDQSPFVIYRFGSDGTYSLKVKCYKPVSGGQFTVKMRTIHAVDTALGAVTHEIAAPAAGEAEVELVFRIPAKKETIYDLRRVTLMNRAFAGYAGLVRIIGPTGVEKSDFEAVPTADSTPVFKALKNGDYYIEYRSNGERQVKTDYRTVTVSTTKTTSNETIDLDAGELKIIEFPVKPNLIVRTTLGSSQVLFDLSAPAGVAGRETSDGESYGNNAYWTWFRANRDSDADVIRVFHGTGTARYTMRSIAAKPQQVTFKNVESLPAWQVGDPYKSTIEIGDSRLFLLTSTKSELMRVFAGATHFQPKLDIYRLNGDIANSFTNRRTHSAADDLYFPDADTFIVRLSCEGNGGSGEFNMKRDSLQPLAYALGSAQTMKLDGENFGLYSVNLEAGKRYQLTTDQPDNFLRTDLLDDDGQFLTSQRIRFDKVEVQYFVPTKSGRHRLWLRGAPGVRHFRFELHVPPTIGG
jgi:hypothetical protein